MEGVGVQQMCADTQMDAGGVRGNSTAASAELPARRGDGGEQNSFLVGAAAGFLKE